MAILTRFFDLDVFCTELCAELQSAGMEEKTARVCIARALRTTVTAEEEEE